MAKYAVVEFEDEKEVSVVPSAWMTDEDTKCYWPPYRKTAKVTKAIKEGYSPKDNWIKYTVKVFARSGKFFIHYFFHVYWQINLS